MQYQTTLSQVAYVDLLIQLISAFEGHEPQARNIGDGKATVGYGYTFNRADNVAIWTAAGVSLSLQELAALRVIDAAAPANRTALAISTFPRVLTRDEAKALLGQTYQQYESPAVTLGMPISLERAAFVSLSYNRGIGAANRTAAFASAVQSSNRAEAWYEIRYNSIGTVDQFANGKAKRRYVESQLFGLYDNPAGPSSTDEAKQIYAMMARHRDTILKYESLYGLPPDGSSAARNTISLANADPNLTAVVTVQPLAQALTPARDAFIAWVNTQMPPGETPLVASDWNPAAIAYGDATQSSQSLDARLLDGKGKSMDKNLLVGVNAKNSLYGGTGDDILLGGNENDLLDGGKGADTLIGGVGVDTYLVDADGKTKRIVDSDGFGTIAVRIKTGTQTSELDLSGTYIKENGTWTSSDKSVVISGGPGNYVATVVANGTKIAFWSGFDPTGDYGELGIRLLDDIVPAATKTGSAGNNIFLGTWRHTVQGEYGDYRDIILSDSLTGAAGHDELYGLAGDDILDGGDGDDLLSGGWGNDIVTAGAGNDLILPDGLREEIPTAEQMDTSAPPARMQGEQFTGYTAGLTGAANIWLLKADYAMEFPEDDAGRFSPGNDVIDAGEGNDSVFAGMGGDTVWLGSGDDVGFGNGGADVIHGGAGKDLIYGDGDLQTVPAAGVVMVSFTDAAEHGNDTIDGGDGDDQIVGGGGADVIFGGAGDDWISADGQQYTDPQALQYNLPVSIQGNDFVDAGDGDDITFGFAGDDTLVGGSGFDLLDGGDGDDYLMGGAGSDTLFGGEGQDTLISDSGTDFLSGGAGADTFFITGAVARVDGGDGADIIRIGPGSDVTLGAWQFGTTPQSQPMSLTQTALVSGSDADFIDFVEDDESSLVVTMAVGTADPQSAVFSFSNSNTSLRLSGNLSTLIGSSVDAFSFGTGTTWSRSDILDKLRGIATDGSDRLYALNGDTGVLDGLAGDDVLLGSNGGDLLAGGDDNDTLRGYYGDDSLSGGSGDDEMYGGEGSDTYIGGVGNDAYRDDSSTSDDIFRFGIGDGNDLIDDRGGVDRVELGTGITTASVRVRSNYGFLSLTIGSTDSLLLTSFDTSSGTFNMSRVVEIVRFGDGTQWDLAQLKQESLKTSSGNDSVSGYSDNESIDSGDGDDTVSGSAGNDTIFGGNGSDILDGGQGSDVLHGGSGDDYLSGRDGNDVLEGGAGNDTLTGDSGLDVFQFGVGDGSDTIYFDGLADRIEFGQGLVASTMTVQRDAYGSVSLSFGTGESMTMSGLVNYFDGAIGPISAGAIHFADGSFYNEEQLRANLLSQAMSITAGDDLRYLLNGNETLDGGAGNDTIYGLGGSDALLGNTGDDKLYGGIGNDNLQGGSGNDMLAGEDGNDTLFGGDGDDTLIGDYGDDFLDGGAGNDNLSGLTGNDTFLFGIGDGQDTIGRDYGGSQTSVLRLKAGVAPSDVIAKQVADTFWGGMNALELGIEGTSDKVTISKYFDTVARPLGQIVFDNGVVWDTARIQQELDTGASRNLTGTSGDDTLVGGSSYDTLFGGAGADTLNGRAGNDSLDGGLGNDVYLFGRGDGRDTLSEATVDDSAGKLNILRFKSGVSAADLTVRRVGTSLEVSINGTFDVFVVTNFYLNGDPTNVANPIQRIEFSNDPAWDLSTIQQRAAAAASLNLTGTPGSDTLVGAAGDDTLSGAAGNDLLQGNAGNDRLDGGSGTDTLQGGAGDDSYVVDSASDVVVENANEGYDGVESSVSYVLSGNVERLTLTGTASINGTGNAGFNALFGNSGNNRLDGGTNPDSLIGGAGDDYYLVDDVGDTLLELANEGTDTVETALSWTLGSNTENLVLTGTGAVNGTGNSLNNALTGNGANNTLTGEAGNDTLDGGAGNDMYLFGRGDGRDTINEAAADAASGKLNVLRFKAGVSAVDVTARRVGTALELGISGTSDVVTVNNFYLNNDPGNASNPLQRIEFSGGDAAWDLAAIQQHVVTTGNQAPTVAAPIADQTVAEGATLNYTVPAATFIDPNASDVLTYSATLSNGAALPSWLSFNAATRTFAGTAPIVTPGSLTVRVTARDAGNLSVYDDFNLAVTIQDRTVSGTVGADALTGYSGNDTLSGLAGNDLLQGNAGNDLLDGGLGGDSMIGGLGDDIYVVDSYDDIVTENVNEGHDTVRSSLSLGLAPNVEDLTLTDPAATYGGGNELANVITGNAADNALEGFAGNDRLIGNAGNDWLNGGAGADTMVGGSGDDNYVVDDAGDSIVEAASEGYDTVSSSISWTLGNNVDGLELVGSANLDGTGNALDNWLKGNAGNNVLNGGSGGDEMSGGLGNDTYVVDGYEDTTSENAGEGIDTTIASLSWTLQANVENLTLTDLSANYGAGNELANVLTGNAADNALEGFAGNDSLVGNSGNDWMNGGTGADTMAGGTGDDLYVVDNTGDQTIEAASEGYDTVSSSISWTLGNNVEGLMLEGSANLAGTGNALDNWIQGNAGNNLLIGGAGFDALEGGEGDDTYDGGAGYDNFYDTSTSSNDTYRWGAGAGLDALTDSGGALDHVDLFAGTTKGQLHFMQDGDNLQLTISGQEDQLTINGWFASTTLRIEEFRLADGDKVLASQVQSLLGAMATFSAAGESGASSIDRRYAQPVRFGDSLAVSAMA